MLTVTTNLQHSGGSTHMIEGSLESFALPKAAPLQKWSILSFGDIWLGRFAQEIIKIISLDLYYGPIAVVCSACINGKKADGVTKRLVRAARAAEMPNNHGYDSEVNVIRFDHIQMGKDTLASPDVLAAYVENVNAECESLLKILESAQYLGEVTHSTQDKIISKGEKLSCHYITALLLDRQVPAQYVDLSDITNLRTFDKQRDETSYADLAVSFARRIQACGDKVPVITGFFGGLQGGMLSSIGAGYTDVCAALVAVGIGAQELRFWKEVDGIFTADPEKVATARLLPSITHSEATELVLHGFGAVHPLALEQAMKTRIPVRIKSIKHPGNDGTVILPDSFGDISSRTPIEDHMPVRGPLLSTSCRSRCKKPPTALITKHDVIVLRIHRKTEDHVRSFLGSVFQILEKWNLPVDLACSSNINVSIALQYGLISGKESENKYGGEDQELQSAIDELSILGNVDVLPKMAIISIVDQEMKDKTAIAEAFFSALAENGINTAMSSQDASKINMSCTLAECDADLALNILHTWFFSPTGNGC